MVSSDSVDAPPEVPKGSECQPKGDKPGLRPVSKREVHRLEIRYTGLFEEGRKE